MIRRGEDGLDGTLYFMNRRTQTGDQSANPTAVNAAGRLAIFFSVSASSFFNAGGLILSAFVKTS